MNKKDPIICLITGPNGAGKTSVSKALVQKFERSALIEFGKIRKIVVGGYVASPGKDEEGKIQASLATKNICALANNFVDVGFNVIIDGVTGKTYLKQYTDLLHGKQIKAFLLLPTAEVLLQRFRGREGENSWLETISQDLHKEFTSKKDESFWSVIDSSNQTIEETADKIFNELVK